MQACCLGPSIGYADVFTYADKDKSCHLDIAALVEVCAKYYKECIAVLNDTKSKCKPSYLGPAIGYAYVFKFADRTTLATWTSRSWPRSAPSTTRSASCS